MELWDAYYADGTPAGRDLVRGEQIPQGLYHMVSEVLVQHIDGTFLLMQRDFSKHFPGMYEASAGGSALKGESAAQAARRELYEETGVAARELTPIYRVVTHDTIYCGFLCVTDCDKCSVALQPGETVSYLWLGGEDFVRFLASESCVSVHRERLMPYFDGARA